MSNRTTVTVTVPVTIEISVELPAGPQAAIVADALATQAAEHFAHVSQAQIRAFNEVNRIHRAGAGTVIAAHSSLAGIGKAAA
ncbi:hypothetical protein [Azospirillum picis]|uniref:PE domain-containing protein n=1 Tax=Azospirillum picis TaxID=488438 RepID=A0ABU0MUU2_9PROT|nr:hypothetical protein [Azospirillum picis]MBP2303411.1 hypothetical protein [Azospirillum picis]MDQ0537263.1 hypothetical protein [Azospirillum picis]